MKMASPAANTTVAGRCVSCYPGYYLSADGVCRTCTSINLNTSNSVCSACANYT